jgi:hypothetical protein
MPAPPWLQTRPLPAAPQSPQPPDPVAASNAHSVIFVTAPRRNQCEAHNVRRGYDHENGSCACRRCLVRSCHRIRAGGGDGCSPAAARRVFGLRLLNPLLIDLRRQAVTGRKSGLGRSFP